MQMVQIGVNVRRFLIFLTLILSVFVVSLSASEAWALENASKEGEKIEVSLPQDSYGRDTPRGTVQGFLQALAKNDPNLAVRYLELGKKDDSEAILQQFKQALDVGGRLQTELQLSNEAMGDLSDKLPQDQDKVGVISTKSGDEIDLIVQRVHDKKTGGQFWQFSHQTLEQLPKLTLNDEPSLVQRYTLQPLVGQQIFGYDLADMMAVFLLSLTCFFITYLVILFLYMLIRVLHVAIRRQPFPIDGKVVLPLAVIVVALILSEVMVSAGVSVTVREPVNRIKEILLWFALTWLLLRVIDTLFGQAEEMSLRKNFTERLSILGLLRKLVKSLLLIFAGIAILGNLGFDLTTGIAALGVGGLALALGAQKTIENLVGSVVVVADRPVSVGDFCKFGTYEGTVIDIGIRSTRIRTLSRTIVTVPNGDFSSMQIENFAARDMFLFMHRLYLKRSSQIQIVYQLVQDLTQFLIDHELTNEEWNQARIAELRQDSYVIEVRAYINATGGADFYDKQSKLIVDMLQKVALYDVEHAIATQNLRVETDPKPPKNLPIFDGNTSLSDLNGSK